MFEKSFADIIFFESGNVGHPLHLILLFGMGIAGCAKTLKVKKITLPSGEEVVDINGVYDTQLENYGYWIQYGSYSTVTEIRQEGSSFVGIRLKATPFHSAGRETFRGELGKNGIKKLKFFTGSGTMDAVGQISDDGKTLKFDIPDFARSTITKK